MDYHNNNKHNKHNNFKDRKNCIHISGEQEISFISCHSNINIGNILEADTDTQKVIIPGDLEVCGTTYIDGPNVARHINSCDACQEKDAYGFEWTVIDDERHETLESICLRCIRRGMMQYVAKENWINVHGDPLTNLRNEMNHKIKELEQKIENK